MRPIRTIMLFCLAIALIGAVACSPSPTPEQDPEATWESFVQAVSENRADDAMQHVDTRRMSERLLEDDEQMQQMSEVFGGPEGIADLLDEQLRAAIEAGDFTLDAEGGSLATAEVANVESSETSATLTVESQGEQGFVHMEIIDGEWKIVMLE